jgi:hypothetical protein
MAEGVRDGLGGLPGGLELGVINLGLPHGRHFVDRGYSLSMGFR